MAPLVARRPVSTAERREWLMFLLLVGPNFLLFGIFVYWPLIYNAYLSFVRWDMLAPVKVWVGWDNYIKDNYPGIDHIAGYNAEGMPTTLEYAAKDKKVLTEDIIWAEPAMTNILTIDVVSGARENPLKEVNSIIMSVNGNQVQPVLSGTANNLTVTYVPTQPLPPNSLIPVTLYACDLRGNCMTSADTYSFTTEPPDLTPPVISNVNVVSTDSDAIITWTTNEPADSKLEYGLTTNYEKPAVSAAPLVSQHSLQLTGLQTQSTYHFRLSSRDFNNNPATTGDLTFQTKPAPASIHSDDFSACVIDSAVWSYIDPVSYTHMTLPTSDLV